MLLLFLNNLSERFSYFARESLENSLRISRNEI